MKSFLKVILISKCCEIWVKLSHIRLNGQPGRGQVPDTRVSSHTILSFLPSTRQHTWCFLKWERWISPLSMTIVFCYNKWMLLRKLKMAMVLLIRNPCVVPITTTAFDYHTVFVTKVRNWCYEASVGNLLWTGYLNFFWHQRGFNHLNIFPKLF